MATAPRHCLRNVEFRLGEKLGEGSFGTVYLATPLLKGNPRFGTKNFVVKRLKVHLEPRDLVSALNECRILKELKHPNIVRVLYTWVDTDSHLYLAMELADGGDLDKLVKDVKASKRVAPTNEEVGWWMAQCLLALQYCHQSYILHRDIKLQNILLHAKGRVVKMADFGGARTIENSAEFAKTRVGTPFFLSPEIIRRQPYNNRTDVWSLGVCLFELMTLAKPFSGADIPELYEAILQNPTPDIQNAIYRAHGYARYDSGLIDMCRAMLEKDPGRRPSVATLMAMPWVAAMVPVVPTPTPISSVTTTTLLLVPGKHIASIYHGPDKDSGVAGAVMQGQPVRQEGELLVGAHGDAWVRIVEGPGRVQGFCLWREKGKDIWVVAPAPPVAPVKAVTPSPVKSRPPAGEALRLAIGKQPDVRRSPTPPPVPKPRSPTPTRHYQPSQRSPTPPRRTVSPVPTPRPSSPIRAPVTAPVKVKVRPPSLIVHVEATPTDGSPLRPYAPSGQLASPVRGVAVVAHPRPSPLVELEATLDVIGVPLRPYSPRTTPTTAQPETLRRSPTSRGSPLVDLAPEVDSDDDDCRLHEVIVEALQRSVAEAKKGTDADAEVPFHNEVVEAAVKDLDGLPVAKAERAAALEALIRRDIGDDYYALVHDVVACNVTAGIVATLRAVVGPKFDKAVMLMRILIDLLTHG